MPRDGAHLRAVELEDNSNQEPPNFPPPGPPDEGTPVPLPAIQGPFIPLGHNRGKFYFVGIGSQVREFTAKELHSIPSLCELAPLNYWEMEYPKGKNGGADTAKAGSALMKACHDAKIYDPSRLRGRGAWLDGERSVLHFGDRLMVNGVLLDGLKLPGSPYIYENAIPLALPLVDPLSAREAKQLLDLCRMPSWDAPDHMGRLLAGWCVIAPVCGAMPWRPHLWLTGEKSSGKSWIMDNIVSLILGPIAFHVQSVTTEAGIRQDLGSDARPVIFDEAETQTEADRQRIQSVLNLARQASTEGNAAIVKGSSGGKATHYRIRSAFAFSSINYGVTQAADESRIVSLTLKSDTAPGSHERFEALRAKHAEVITHDFPGRLMARTLTLLPIIRHNAGVFADAIARAGHGRRTGDTVGVLLAGAWSLRSDRRVDAEAADTFLAETPWLKEAVSKAAVQPEWQRALGFLMQHKVRVQRERGAEDVPVAELVAVAMRRSWAASLNMLQAEAERALARIGLKISIRHEREGPSTPVLAVMNNSTEIATAFSRSPWAAAWHSTLARTPGARPAQQPIRFGPRKERALTIPISEALPDEPEESPDG